MLILHVKKGAIDLLLYKNLVHQHLQTKSALEEEGALCQRERLQKDLFFPGSDGERLHIRMESEKSFVKLEEKKGKISAKEVLEKICCIAQEEILREEGRQNVRTFFSEKGIYLFPSHQFQTEQAEMFFYTLAGQELPSFADLPPPYMQGKAAGVFFNQGMKKTSFSASHLQLHFDPGENFP